MSYKETLFGVVPDTWVVSTIGDVVELKQGLQISKKLRSDSKSSENIPLLKITDLPSKVFSEYVKDIPEGYIANKDDIIYTRTGQVGLVYTGVFGCVHNNCFKVIPNEEILDRGYVYYYLKSDRMIQNSNNIASGSVQKDLTHKAFKTVKIGYPTLKKQKKIARILFSLDKKIELNNEMNKTLEEMAQTLFKRWFVDFEFPDENGEPYKSNDGEMVESEIGMIPKGWEVYSITDLVDSVSVKHKFNNDKVVFLNTSDVLDGEVLHNNYSDVNSLPGQAKKSIQKNDILYSEIRPKNKRYAFVDFECEDYVVSTKLMVLRAKSVLTPILVYKYLTSNEIVDYLQSIAESRSGTFPQITFKELEKLKIALPDKETVSKWGIAIDALFNNIQENKRENKLLTELRDSLLPKLMSGEIRVKDIEASL